MGASNVPRPVVQIGGVSSCLLSPCAPALSGGGQAKHSVNPSDHLSPQTSDVGLCPHFLGDRASSLPSRFWKSEKSVSDFCSPELSDVSATQGGRWAGEQGAEGQGTRGQGMGERGLGDRAVPAAPEI